MPGGLQIDSTKFVDSPATHDVAMLVVNEFYRSKAARAEHWRQTYEQWPKEWAERSAEGSFHLKLTLDELGRLGETSTVRDHGVGGQGARPHRRRLARRGGAALDIPARRPAAGAERYC